MQLSFLGTDTIGEVKRAIQASGGGYIDVQQLSFRGELLQDHLTLNNYNIILKDIVHLAIHPSIVQVFVKTQTGKTVTI